MSVCRRRSVPCWGDARHEYSVGDSPGKTASRKKSFRVRFSATQADGRIGSDLINAGVVPSSWLMESQGGCAEGGEVIMLSKRSVPILCETLTLQLLFYLNKQTKKRSTINRGAFLTSPKLCLNEQNCLLTSVARSWHTKPQREHLGWEGAAKGRSHPSDVAQVCDRVQLVLWPTRTWTMTQRPVRESQSDSKE